MSSDHFAIRVVLVTMSTGFLLGLSTIAYLSVTGTAVPDQLDRLVTLLAGGIGGLLAKTTSGPQEVTTPPGAPLPVTETPDPPKAEE